MKFNLVNIGCKVNRVEIDAVAAQLMSQGATLAQPGEEADIVVVNTCTVTAEADKKTRKAVRQALKAQPGAQLLVTGCAAVMNPSWFAELDPRVHVVGKGDVARVAWELVGEHSVEYLETEAATGSVAHGGGGSMLRQSCFGKSATGAFQECATLSEAKLVPLGRTARGTSPSIRDGACDVSSLESPLHVFDDGQRASNVENQGGPVAGLGVRTGLGLRTGAGFRTRVGVKVQDGCNNACTYCIVHVARGASRSVLFDQVVEDARAHARAGVRELVLTGINLGAYDDGGRGLSDVLEAVMGACPDARVRIGSVEPRDVDEALIGLMARSEGRVCRHLHLPLQAGSSRVLAEMNRPYDARFFLDLVGRLRAAMPGISLSTDVIVGFPGETEDDFEQTLDVCAASGFSRMHVFRYSRRAGTPAAERTDQVAPAVMADRAKRLQELGVRLRHADAERRQGTTELVLVEREGRGVTESYHEVSWDPRRQETPAAGGLWPVRLTGLLEDGVFHL